MDTLYNSRLPGFSNLNKKNLMMETAITEEGILSLLIVLGSSISLVGLVFAFITYSLFSDLRNLSGTSLINLLAAMFMTQLLYVVGVGGVLDSELCVSLVFGLQYVRLCVFCWLLSIIHHMHKQFKVHIQTLIPRPNDSIHKEFIGYSLFSWGLPGIFLLISIFIQYTDKSGDLMNVESLKMHNCWFLDNRAFYWCFLLPSGLLFFFNIWYLICAIISVYKAVTIQLDRKIREKMLKRRKMQISLFFKITLIVYSLVVLGGFYHLQETQFTRIIYHLIQGLQGIIVAMMVTCNCQVLKLYSKTIKTKKRKLPQMYGVDKNALNKSTSMQLLTWEPPPDIV